MINSLQTHTHTKIQYEDLTVQVMSSIIIDTIATLSGIHNGVN